MTDRVNADIDNERETSVILHIGLHKTGSTSLQLALGDNRSSLASQCAAYYRGAFNPDNHIELFLSCLRPGVETFASNRHRLPDREILFEETRCDIERFTNENLGGRLIFSAEGLSYFRTEEECERLKSLFPASITSFQILLILRDKESYLASYKKQIGKKMGRQESTDPNSAFFVGRDTWLIDFETLISVYENTFGPVQIIEFSREGLLQRILDFMGIELATDVSTYQNNRTGQSGKLGRIAATLREKVAVRLDRTGLRPLVRRIRRGSKD